MKITFSQAKLVKILPFYVENGLLISPRGQNLCRLAGVPISAPVINYRWPSFPESLIKEDYRRKLINRSMWFANYFPTFLHWWVTQKWLPSNSVIEINPTFFNKRDIDILETIPGFQLIRIRRLQRKHQQQGCRREKRSGARGGWWSQHTWRTTLEGNPGREKLGNLHQILLVVFALSGANMQNEFHY